MELACEQIRQFLDEAAGLKSSALESSGFAAILAERAEITQELVERHFGLPISMDESGVKALDELLMGMHDVMKPEKAEPESMAAADYVTVCETLGTLFGEIARKHIGGDWGIGEFDGRQFVALVTPASGKLAVMEKAGRQYLNGKEESVLFMFGVARTMSQVAARVAELSPEEVEERRQRVREDVRRRTVELREKAAAANGSKG
jgi:hypothetical protein